MRNWTLDCTFAKLHSVELDVLSESEIDEILSFILILDGNSVLVIVLWSKDLLQLWIMILRSVLCMIIVFKCVYVYGKSLNYVKWNNTDIDYKLNEIDVDNGLTVKEQAVDVLETGEWFF